MLSKRTAGTAPLLVSRERSSASVPISRFQSAPSIFFSSPKLSTISSQSRRSVYLGVLPALISSSASFLASSAVMRVLLSPVEILYRSSLPSILQHPPYHPPAIHCNSWGPSANKLYRQDSPIEMDVCEQREYPHRLRFCIGRNRP